MHRGWSSAPEARARAVLCRARPSHTPGGTGPPSLLAAPRCQGPGNLLREGGVACPQPSGGVRHKRPGPRAHATRLSPTGTNRRAARRPLHYRGCGARRRVPEGHVATQRARKYLCTSNCRRDDGELTSRPWILIFSLSRRAQIVLLPRTFREEDSRHRGVAGGEGERVGHLWRRLVALGACLGSLDMLHVNLQAS